MSLVKPEKSAAAIAFIFSGFTIATAFAAPLGTYISGFTSWRFPFFAIAVVGVIALILNLKAIPNQKSVQDKGSTFSEQLQLITHPHILLMLSVTILGYGSTFATFTYLSPILQEITKIEAQSVSFVLVAYGIAIAIGNHLGGKFGKISPIKSLLIVFIPQALILAIFHFTAESLYAGFATIIGMGLLAFMSVPLLQSYIMELAKRYVPHAVDLASSLNIASFNGGIAVGTGFGGYVIDHAGLIYTPIAAASMAAVAVVLVLISVKLDRHYRKA